MKKKYRVNYFLVIALFMSLSVNSLHAQPNSPLFHNYTLADGLTDKTVHCIIQDRKGWIWIGTDFGVLRFDGYQFKKFTTHSSESLILSNSLIRTIYEDQSGVIWIGTESNGVFSYNREVYAIKQIDIEKLSNKSAWSIVEDENNNLWIGTEKGINYYNPETDEVEKIISSATAPDILNNDFVRKLFIDKSNRLWVGTDNGLRVLSPNHKLEASYLDYEVPGKELENQIWEIFQDSHENIWIGSYLGGLLKYNSRKKQFTKVDLDKSNDRSNTVRAIHEDKYGDLWVGTRGGLYSISKESGGVDHYSENEFDDFSLVHNSILGLLIDVKGDLWVGTRNGISFLNFERKAFKYIKSFNCGNANLNNNEIYALWEDRKKALWIGTESGGINLYDPVEKKVRYITTDEGLSNNCIKAISPGKNGNILIGTYLGGLNKYNPKTGENTIYLHDENNDKSLSDNSVWAIYEDRNKQVWIGTSAGLDLYDEENETFTNYGKEFEVGEISLIFEDLKERLWLYSTDLKKLTMVTAGGDVKHFPFQTRSILNANDSELWIGTTGDGLVKFNPETNSKTIFTVENGLCSNVIYEMVKEGDRFIWLATNNGLSRFDTKTEEFKNYYESNGLLNNQFNYGAAILLSENVLALGGKRGVDLVNLLELKVNDYIPPVVLTDFRIFNKKVPIKPDTNIAVSLDNFISEIDQITLPYDQNIISFEFSALNYANSKKNTYRYKLVGFDKDWNDIGVNHSANYTNLDFGEYIFRVQGSNNDGRFDKDGLSFYLTITPPFWKTWVFRFIILALIGLAFYVIYVFIVNREKLKLQLHSERQTARQLKELERLKHQFFMNISHEIKSPLSLILGPLNKLENSDLSKESIQAHLGLIKRNTNLLTKLVNQLLDYRKLETGNLKLNLKQGKLNIFLQELVSSFKQFAEDKNIDLELNIVDKAIFFAFDSDKLEKILNNLISNALKYTNSGGRVTVSVSLTFIDELENTNNYIPSIDTDQQSSQFVKFTIRDTGIGIPGNHINKIFDRFRQIDRGNAPASSGVGIGLSLTKEFVKLHNGHIKVKSIEGKGSKFTLLVPFTQLPETISNELGLNSDVSDNTFDGNESKAAAAFDSSKNSPILLIIDDNPDIREFVRHHFTPEYNVKEAADGSIGWRKSLDLVPDIIIADITMPHIDGVELCRRLKNDERTSHIPLMLLTAISSKQKQIDGISAGADDYIVKPFDITVLKAKVDNLLYIRKSLRERFSREILLQPRDIILKSPDEKFLKKVIQSIEKNISHPELDVDFLAKNVGVSRTQLYRKINALTDMAVKEFVKDIRLKRAAQLLQQNSLNISEIVMEVGFNDASYFRKCFKEKYGVSASKYRQS